MKKILFYGIIALIIGGLLILSARETKKAYNDCIEAGNTPAICDNLRK